MRDPTATTAVFAAGELTMPDWLYRLLRRVSPSLRAQERRLAETQVELATAQRVRNRSDRIQRMLHSYTRAGRRLGDLRSHR